MQVNDGYDLMVRRKRLGLHQRELARLVGSRRPADISELENGLNDKLRAQVEQVLDQLEVEASNQRGVA